MIFLLKILVNYIIENSKKYLIYLIPGEKLSVKFDWYGEQRAEAFNIFKNNPLKNDIEDKRLFLYTYDNLGQRKKELAGGQRFLFIKKGYLKNKEHSYLESLSSWYFRK